MARASSARNWIFFSRRCTAKQTPCFRKRPAWRAKRWPSPVCRWKFAQRSKSCANRCRTSNDSGERGCTAGADRVRPFRLGQVDAGAESFGAARDHAFGVVYHKAPPRDRGQWEVYDFVTDAEFASMVQRGEFLEY